MKIKKTDILITASLLVISLLMAFAVSNMGTHETGQILRVEVNGEVKYEVPLDKDQVLEIDDGVHFNKIVIKDGKAYMDEANCRDQICTQMQEISIDGETIICLPNRVYLEVVDQAGQDDSIDSINR